jgi:glycogen debranching enzyme
VAQAKQYKLVAKKLQQATLKELWMPEVGFFAQGLDRDNKGERRQIKTLTSNVGLLLNSKILQDLTVHTRKPYVEGIVTTICGPEFMTVAGIRCRALRHKDIPGFVDYHGTDAIWPKETFNIARGLASYGYETLARQLDDRILNSVATSGDFYELFYVEDNGQTWFDHKESIEHFSHKSLANHLSIPEPGQAWVISAVIHIIVNSAHKLLKPKNFEKEILKTFPNITTLNV